MPRHTKYTLSARFYDVISAEWPVYRAGRVAAVDLLDLPPGSRVLDIGCGTGLNFALLQSHIGPSGSITALDSSEQMLAAARRKCDSNGWRNVRFVTADATTATPEDLGTTELGNFDAVIATYTLSLMSDWPSALDTAISATRSGGQIAVVDMQKPTGPAAAWTPLAKLACRLGGSDIDAHPWESMDASLDSVRSASVRGGHIQVRVGAVR